MERPIAHVCETGSGRCSWLRGIERVRMTYLTQGAACPDSTESRIVRATQYVLAPLRSPCSRIFNVLSGLARSLATAEQQVPSSTLDPCRRIETESR